MHNSIEDGQQRLTEMTHRLDELTEMFVDILFSAY